jgi:hypothetical protein
MRAEGNAPKNVDFSFTKMLQHTGRFWSRISQQKKKVTTLEHPPYSPGRLQLIFACFLD